MSLDATVSDVVATDLNPRRRTRRLATGRWLMANTPAEVSFKITAVVDLDSEPSAMFDTIRGDLVTAVKGDGDSPGALQAELVSCCGELDTAATLQDLEALSFATSAIVIQVRTPKEEAPPMVIFLVALGILPLVFGVSGACCVGIRRLIFRPDKLEPGPTEDKPQSLAIDMPECEDKIQAVPRKLTAQELVQRLTEQHQARAVDTSQPALIPVEAAKTETAPAEELESKTAPGQGKGLQAERRAVTPAIPAGVNETDPAPAEETKSTADQDEPVVEHLAQQMNALTAQLRYLQEQLEVHQLREGDTFTTVSDEILMEPAMEEALITEIEEDGLMTPPDVGSPGDSGVSEEEVSFVSEVMNSNPLNDVTSFQFKADDWNYETMSSPGDSEKEVSPLTPK